MIHRTELKQDYNFASKQEIGVYTIRSEKPELDEIFSSVLQLDFLSKGYAVKDINRLLIENSDSISETNYKKVIDSLRLREYLKTNDVYIISRLKWDSVFVATQLEERIDRIYKGYNVQELTTDLVMFDRQLQNPIFSYSAIDTAKLYFPRDKDYYIFTEQDWMIAARQFLKNLDQFPICSNPPNSDKTKKLKISFWADKSYRETFPKEWQERIQRIATFASDILRTQFGVELEIYTLNKWDSEFESSLEQTFENFEQKPVSFTDVIKVGITFDESLANSVMDRSHLGLAKPMGTSVVITGQPTYPGMQYWNPIEEAITLVHEIAHLFGAMHVPNEKSIMNPMAGYLSFRFDDANQSIVKMMNKDFLDIDEKQRTKNYISKLIEMNQNNYENKLPILTLISSQIYTLNYYYFNEKPSIRVRKKEILNLVQDSVYARAVLGVTEYNLNHFEKSVELLSKVVELKPNFAEAHWYLSLALQKTGDITKAEKHKMIAKPFRNTWILDEKKIY
jgi:tetratricopeptide (TPR) repeat protein